MSVFWSTWVIVLVVLTLGISLFLFVWSLRVAIPTQPDGTSGHVWAHGVLREGIKPLPLWWILLSIAAFVAAIIYLVLYPALGAGAGLLGWTSRGELARDEAANRKLEAPLHDRMRGKSVAALAADPEVLRVGHVLFVDNCAGCHGRDARGNRAIGAPDLTDGDWLYGGDANAILTSIQNGRTGAMPAFAPGLPEDSILDLAHYVASLSGESNDSLRAQLGKRHFSNCAACHGADGKGNAALGAPNLTDGTWLYAANGPRGIAEIIAHGRKGVMPPWRGRLSDDDTRILAAWVLAQSISPTRSQ